MNQLRKSYVLIVFVVIWGIFVSGPVSAATLIGGDLSFDFDTSGAITGVRIDGRDLPVSAYSSGLCLREVTGGADAPDDVYVENFNDGEFDWFLPEMNGDVLFQVTDDDPHEGAYSLSCELDGVDAYVLDLTAGEQSIGVLEPFEWPEGAGSFDGAAFWGLMTDMAITDVIGEIGYVIFGWM